MSLNISKINTWPPAQIQQNTLYLCKSEDDQHYTAYLTDKDSTAFKRLKTFEELRSGFVHFSGTVPEADTPENFWYNTSEGSLYIKYLSGETVTWVEAVPSVPLPDFGGNGQENTVARSDHEHTTYANYGTFEW